MCLQFSQAFLWPNAPLLIGTEILTSARGIVTDGHLVPLLLGIVTKFKSNDSPISRIWNGEDLLNCALVDSATRGVYIDWHMCKMNKGASSFDLGLCITLAEFHKLHEWIWFSNVPNCRSWWTAADDTYIICHKIPLFCRFSLTYAICTMREKSFRVLDPSEVLQHNFFIILHSFSIFQGMPFS